MIPASEVVIERPKPMRVLSVDMLRGITIALMILVNDPGDWGHKFSQLEHAEWNGWTLTDLVFPTFLFLVGASIVFSIVARAAKGEGKRRQAGHIVLRSVKIATLAIVLAYFPRMHWTHMRLYGVLMRIAICYLFAALILLMTRRVWVLVGIIGVLLVGYWVLLRFAVVPGAGHPVRDFPLLDKDLNLTAWIDRWVSAETLKWLHTGVLYEKTRDPEGLLSSLPSVATVLIGALTGIWMRRAQARGRMLLGLAVAGVVGVVAGTVWGWWFPVNKNLWTSSFVLLTAGWALLALAGCSWLVDGRSKPWSKWREVVTWPWFVFGSNAIAAFTIAVVYVKVLAYFKITGADGVRRSLWGLAYSTTWGRHGSNEWTSLGFAVTFVILCFLPVWVMWRNKIFLKM